MRFDIPWTGLTTEIILAGLVVICLALDLLIQGPVDKAKPLCWIARIGVALALGLQIYLWGDFGTGFGGSFVQDGFSCLFKTLFLVSALFILQMIQEYRDELKRGQAEFVILVLTALLGMCFLVSANEFLLFFIALETLTISLYIITSYLSEDDRSIEAGVKFLVLGALSSALFLYGLSFIYGVTGSTSFIEIQKHFGLPGDLALSFGVGMVLMLAALGFKIAAFPFQFWVPDVYEGAPTPITAFLAMGSKIAGFAALMRLLLTVFMPAQETLLQGLFAAAAGLTILYGNLGAIPQKNIKRLMAYSSIGHAGYLLMGLATFWQTGKEALLFYLVSYLFSSAGAFLVIVWVTHEKKDETLHAFAGLGQSSPMLAAGMLLALCSLAGVPPLSGFFSKFYLISAAVKADLLWLAAIGLINVVTSLYYYLGIVKIMYAEPLEQPLRFGVSVSQKLMQALSMAGILFLGIYPTPILQVVDEALLNFLRF